MYMYILKYSVKRCTYAYTLTYTYIYIYICRYAKDDNWKDLILFYEYFDGDSGRGLGASHQTGWYLLHIYIYIYVCDK